MASSSTTTAKRLGPFSFAVTSRGVTTTTGGAGSGLASPNGTSTLSYDSGGHPNQLTFLYTPVGAGAAPLPTLLAGYPGSADTWEGVSIPLAAAGYAVIAVGPAYALDLEDDIAELQRLVGAGRTGPRRGHDPLTIGNLWVAWAAYSLPVSCAARAVSTLPMPPD